MLSLYYLLQLNAKDKEHACIYVALIIIIIIKNLFSQKIHVVFVFNELNDLLA